MTVSLFLLAQLPLALLTLASAGAQPTPKGTGKVIANQPAPAFSSKDHEGNQLSISSLRGSRVLLTFYRNVGCPICNLRFHELEKQAQQLKDMNIVVIAVYESSPENLAAYLADQPKLYTRLIADPEQQLYALYGVERSMGKMMKGMAHGAMSKMKQGKRLFTQKIKQDGNSNRIGADFLLDETGSVILAHYGRYLGDHLSVNQLKQAIH